MTQKIDFILDGLELRASAQAVSLASGANPFAPRVSGGMTYRDFTIWNVWEQASWQAGGLKPFHTDNGFLYSTLETRYPGRITLPPLPTVVDKVGGQFGSADYAHLVEYLGATWLGYGTSLYKWSTVSQRWEEQIEFSSSIKALIEFAGLLFVGFGDAANVISVDVASLAQTEEDIRASHLFLYNGLLYAAQGNLLQYTNYEADPVEWETLTVGGSSETITGLAAMMNDILSSQILYVSTEHKLYAVLAGDIVSDVSPWPGISPNNGKMLNHMGDIYAVSGEGMVRITKSGDLIPMGIDLGTGLPTERAGSVIAISSTLSFMHILVAGTATSESVSSSVWSWSGEGWHQVLSCQNNKRAVGMFYSRALNRLFVLQNDGTTLHVFLPDEASVSRRGTNQRYTASGSLDTCVFYGDMRSVQKMWGAIELHGTFPAGTSAIVWYSTDETSPLSSSTWSASSTEWNYLGYVDGNKQPLVLPKVSGVALRVRVTLQTSDNTKTPMVEAIVVRYIPRVTRQWQWQMTLNLPVGCLQYRDGTPVEDYSQELWDTRLREICDELVPVTFTDIDGRNFQVVVTSFSRRLGNVGLEDCTSLVSNIDWNITLLQIDGSIV